MKIILKYIFFQLLLFVSYSAGNAQTNIEKLDLDAFNALEKHSETAQHLATKIISVAKPTDSSKYLINANTILGIVNKDKGFYVSSLNFYLKALRFAEKADDKERVSASYNNIGVIYQLQRNFQTAIKYFRKSLDLEENFNYPLQKSIRYYNLGDCYKELDSFDLALSFFNNSLLIEQRYKKTEGVIYAYLGIAEVYLEIGQLEDAKRMLDKVKLKISETYIEECILYHKLLGVYYFKNSLFKESLLVLSLAEAISNKNNFPIHLLEIFKVEIDVLENMKSWEYVSKKYKQYSLLDNKLSAIAIKNKINDLTYNNEIQKKELEFSLIQEERDFAEKLSKYNKKIAFFLIALLLFVVGFVFYGFKKN
jgi:tetratricopeptide (TPR) repeat protein